MTSADQTEKTATRSERVTVRPFEQIDAAETAFTEVKLVVGGDPFSPGPVVLAEDSLNTAKMRIILPAPAILRQSIDQTGVPAANCALVVMVTSRTHRANELLLKERLTEEADYPDEFALDRAAAELVLNDRAGYTITVAVVLLDQIPPAPLRPSMPGTWLTRAVFKVSVEKDDASFSPEELTEEVRITNNLPEGVLRYIAFDDLLAADELSDCVHVYVEPNVLRWMLSNETDPVAIQQQVELAILAYDLTAQAIVRAIRAECGDPGRSLTEADLEDYPPLHRFIEGLASKCDRSVSDIIQMAEDGQLIRPFLEAKFEATKFTLDALKD